jgi:hypothetical protein
MTITKTLKLSGTFRTIDISPEGVAQTELDLLRAENAKLRAALEQAQRVLAIAFNPGDEHEITLLRSTCQHTANICSGVIAGKGAE